VQTPGRELGTFFFTNKQTRGYIHGCRGTWLRLHLSATDTLTGFGFGAKSCRGMKTVEDIAQDCKDMHLR